MNTVQIIAKGSDDAFKNSCKRSLLRVTGLTPSEIVAPSAAPIVKQALEASQLRTNSLLYSGLVSGFSIVKERNGEFIGTQIKCDRSGRFIVRSIRQPIPESHARLIRNKRDLVRAIAVCRTVYARIQFGKLKGFHKIPKQTASTIANQMKADDTPKDWKLTGGCFGEMKDNCLYLSI